MDTATMIIIVILIFALLFFGYTILKSSSSPSSRAVSYPSTSGYIGGGCGR